MNTVEAFSFLFLNSEDFRVSVSALDAAAVLSRHSRPALNLPALPDRVRTGIGPVCLNSVIDGGFQNINMGLGRDYEGVFLLVTVDCFFRPKDTPKRQLACMMKLAQKFQASFRYEVIKLNARATPIIEARFTWNPATFFAD